jgi:hypothetical protein
MLLKETNFLAVNPLLKLRIHPYRTLDPWWAAIFVLPFDLGVWAQWDRGAGGAYRMHQQGGCDANGYLAEKLTRKAIREHSKSYGHDFLLINGLFSMFNYNCCRVLAACINCTVISQDTSGALDTWIYTYLAKTFKNGYASDDASTAGVESHQELGWNRLISLPKIGPRPFYRWQGISYVSVVHTEQNFEDIIHISTDF